MPFDDADLDYLPSRIPEPFDDADLDDIPFLIPDDESFDDIDVGKQITRKRPAPLPGQTYDQHVAPRAPAAPGSGIDSSRLFQDLFDGQRLPTARPVVAPRPLTRLPPPTNLSSDIINNVKPRAYNAWLAAQRLRGIIRESERRAAHPVMSLLRQILRRGR